MDARILIIDDDTELCVLLCDFLSLDGFNVSSVHDGKEAVSHCKSVYCGERQDQYSAIVLDIMLPGMQGLEVLRKLREFSNTPIIMLTARGEDTDRILGLELGADDYLPKPCNPRELSARLRAILRRVQQGQTDTAIPSVIIVGETRIDTTNRSASYRGNDLKVTSSEFNILQILLSCAGEVVDKGSLNQRALGRALSAYDRSIDVHISKLRKKLSGLGGEDLILSVRGVGYQFVSSPIGVDDGAAG
ncbi:MAG: response regulator transcription factor [Proteobacteria bacterium]|nr:response regulator transcription factor [Pseudomonadota bacterium]